MQLEPAANLLLRLRTQQELRELKVRLETKIEVD